MPSASTSGRSAYFTPDEIAEAFAAARGIASPTQLRTVMKQDGRDLVAQFRALAPERRRRSRCSVGACDGSCWPLGLAARHPLLRWPTSTGCSRPPSSRSATSRRAAPSDVMILMAQAVPSATDIPCRHRRTPAGWKAGALSVQRDRARFWLSRTRPAAARWRSRCCRPRTATSGTPREVPQHELEGMQRFERSSAPAGAAHAAVRTSRTAPVRHVRLRVRSRRVTTRSSSPSTTRCRLQPRAELVAEVERRSELVLCGARAPPCVGGP